MSVASDAPVNSAAIAHAASTAPVEAIPLVCRRSEAAKLLRVSERTLDRWLRRGVIRAVNGGATPILISGAEIARFVGANR